MDDYLSLLALMDDGQRTRALELFALAVMLGLGWWRIRSRRREREEDQNARSEPAYDMRRDGQRFSA